MSVEKKKKNINERDGQGQRDESGQAAAEPVSQPDGLVVYDPDRPLYERGHVCVLLAKVMETLHSE